MRTDAVERVAVGSAGAVDRHGDREGVADADQHCSYGDFAARVAGTAEVLAERGLAGGAVGVVAPNTVDLAVLVFAYAAADVLLVGFVGDHLPALRRAAFGGSAFPPDLLPEIRRRLPGVALHNVYGLSETHSPATILRDDEFAGRPTSVGRPLPCMEARVVDADGAAVDPAPTGSCSCGVRW